MSSLKLPETLPTPDREEVFSAVADVAERSFFAMVDPCDESRFEELAAPHAEWLIATVRFEEPGTGRPVALTVAVLRPDLFRISVEAPGGSRGGFGGVWAHALAGWES